MSAARPWAPAVATDETPTAIETRRNSSSSDSSWPGRSGESEIAQATSRGPSWSRKSRATSIITTWTNAFVVAARAPVTAAAARGPWAVSIDWSCGPTRGSRTSIQPNAAWSGAGSRRRSSSTPPLWSVWRTRSAAWTASRTITPASNATGITTVRSTPSVTTPAASARRPPRRRESRSDQG